MRLTDADEVTNDLLAVKHIYPLHMIRAINAMPTIEAEPVKYGRWIAVPSSDMVTGKAYECSECKKNALWLIQAQLLP